MSFNEHLRKAKNDDNQIGDFARDWIADKSGNKPRSSKTFAPIERYLKKHHASAQIVEIGREAWNQWRKQEEEKPEAV